MNHSDSSSFFQDELDKQIIHFDSNLDRDVSQLLKRSRLTISVAESLTGGMLSQRLTRLPGSSGFFIGGLICYTPLTKIEVGNVSASTIRSHGLVSEEVAIELVQGLKKNFKSDLCISTTGVAGPATKDYPEDTIGQVFIGFSLKNEEKVMSFKFNGNRQSIRTKATQAALGFLKNWLTNQAF